MLCQLSYLGTVSFSVTCDKMLSLLRSMNSQSFQVLNAAYAQGFVNEPVSPADPRRGDEWRSRITRLLLWRDIPLGALVYQFYLTEASGVPRFSS